MPDGRGLPDEDDLLRLPRWARVAFAARCAERVEPVFRRWAEAGRHADAVRRAIEVAYAYADAYVAAAPADAAPAAADAAYAAHEAAADAAGATHEATEAAYAAFAAAGAAANDTYAAQEAVVAAVAADAAARFAARVHSAAVRRDYADLLTAAESQSWTDDTPVPRDFFGPLWPDGEPAGWPNEVPAETPPEAEAQASPSFDGGVPGEVVVRLEVPEDATDDEVLEAVRQLVGRADDLYRALGGNGLKVASLDVMEEAGVPVGVTP